MKSRVIRESADKSLARLGRKEATANSGGRDGVSLYPATPLIVALSPRHSDITRFRPWSPIVTENHLDCAESKKFQKLLRRLEPLTFRHFGTHFVESFRMSKSS